eukprot:gb/GEZN01020472.1/.p1 GENE.gb/GEZN01020472.1/~~gb/GEZN01020472.1/.p1  ORF type:complete len:179 (-),score=4.38 gb/GEZN01020472.1/:85-621(-)
MACSSFFREELIARRDLCNGLNCASCNQPIGSHARRPLGSCSEHAISEDLSLNFEYWWDSFFGSHRFQKPVPIPPVGGKPSLLHSPRCRSCGKGLDTSLHAPPPSSSSTSHSWCSCVCQFPAEHATSSGSSSKQSSNQSGSKSEDIAEESASSSELLPLLLSTGSQLRKRRQATTDIK